MDWRERFAPAFDAEFREWLAAAAKGGATGPSAWDGYVATVVTDAGVAAIKSGARVAINCANNLRSIAPSERENWDYSPI